MTDINLNNETSNNESGVLAKLWRKIIDDKHLKDALPYFVSRYIKGYSITSGDVKSIKRKTRSTIVNNICATEMTFKTFLDLIFNFLCMKKVDITITLTAHNDETSTHTISLSGEITKSQSEVLDNTIGELHDNKTKDSTKNNK